jgi:hypothetical protein
MVSLDADAGSTASLGGAAAEVDTTASSFIDLALDLVGGMYSPRWYEEAVRLGVVERDSSAPTASEGGKLEKWS